MGEDPKDKSTDGGKAPSHSPPDVQGHLAKAGSGRPPAVMDSQSQELFKQILQNQTEDLRLRGEEIKLKGQEQRYKDDNNERQFKYALAAIKSQESDLAGQRNHIAQVTTMRYWFLFGGGVLIVAVLIFAMMSGNKEFAMEGLKLLAFFGGGTGVGYGFGRRARGRQQPVEDEDEASTNDSRDK